MSNNDNEDDQESDEDENGEIHCPFCKTTDSCDHLLLMVDLTFRSILPKGSVIKPKTVPSTTRDPFLINGKNIPE